MIDYWVQPSKDSMSFFRKEQIAQSFWTLNLYAESLEKERMLSLYLLFIYKLMIEVGTQIIQIQPQQKWLLNLRFPIHLLLQPDGVLLSLSDTLLHSGLLLVLQICKAVFFFFQLGASHRLFTLPRMVLSLTLLSCFMSSLKL